MWYQMLLIFLKPCNYDIMIRKGDFKMNKKTTKAVALILVVAMAALPVLSFIVSFL